MRYCDNCGAELTEGAEFCGECGAKVEELEQQVQNVELQSKVKKNKRQPVIVIIILLVICIVGIAGYFLYGNYFSKPKQTIQEKPSVKKESVIKKDNLLETIPWEKGSDETEKKVSMFKKNILTDYPDVALEMAFDKEVITVIKEQYAKVDDTEYYNIDYNYENQNYAAVIQKGKEKVRRKQ